MDADFKDILEQCIREMLVWVGFGTLVGLAAKAIMPGRDPGGAIGTMLMGIGGSVIGCGTLMFFWADKRVTPISPIGFVLATGGAFIILLFFRILSGSLFVEAEDGDSTRFWRRRPWRRRTR